VRIVSAFAGALVGGLLWNLAGWGFASFVVSSTKYTAIYSAFAALIVFMLWLYVAWLVLLVGASVAFYHQYPEHISLERGERKLSPRMVERLALALLTEIATDFAAGGSRPTVDDLATRLRVPNGTAAGLIHAMERDGLIVATAEAPAGWLPARPPDSILLSDIMAVVRADGEIPSLSPGGTEAAPAVNKLLDSLERERETALHGKTLADLVATSRQPSEQDATTAALRPAGERGSAAE
jgi:membrane protein